MKFKFAIGLAILILVAAQSFAQSCSGRGGLFAFQGTRERHVVRSFGRGGCSGVAAYGTGCTGATLVQQTVLVPQTRLVVADLPPKAAPQPMPKGPHAPIVAYAPLCQTAEPPLARVGVRVRSVVGAGFHGLAGLLCRTKEVMVAVVTAPVVRLRGAEIHRSFHLLRR